MLTSRRKCGLGIAGVLASLLVGGGVKAAVTGNVYASVAPNADGSPSWAAYDSNAMTALQNGASTGGDPTQPSYYSQVADGADLPQMSDQFVGHSVGEIILGCIVGEIFQRQHRQSRYRGALRRPEYIADDRLAARVAK